MSLKLLGRFFILCLYSANLNAQSYTVDIWKLSVEDGLSNRFITDFYQDSRGFMWIGTWDGLNRYDGYQFNHYTSQNSALISDEISHIDEDENQKLWISSYFSYDKSIPYFNTDILDLQTGSMQSFDQAFKGIAPFAAKDIKWVFSDNKKTIWINTVKNDLYRYHNKRFKHVFTSEEQEDLIILNAKKKFVFVFSGKKDLLMLNKKDLLMLNSEGSIIKKLPFPNGLLRIDDKKNKNLWYFRPKQKKLLYFDPEEDVLQEFDLQPLNLPKAFYDPNASRRISISADNLIWWYQKDTSERFLVLHPSEGIVFDLQAEIASLLSYGTLKIRNIYFDAGNRAWIATEDGIFIITLKKNKFTTLLSETSKNYSCRGIIKDDQGRLYINTLSGRVWIDTETGILKKNTADPLWFGATKDIQGNLWFSHQTAMIEKYNPLNEQSQYYYTQENEQKGYQWSQWTIIRDKTGRVWTGTYHGLHYLDPQTGVYRKFDQYNSFSSLEESTVYHLYEDKKGIWIGASSGLYLLEPGKGITTRYAADEKRPYHIPYDHIIHFYRDTTGIFWLATKGGGLIRFNPEDGSYRQFTTIQGLSNNTIYAVYEDDYGKLWLPSNYGLMQFDKKNHRVHTYLPGDGIAHEEFNRTSHYRDTDGQLYFGGLSGVTTFHPEDFVIKDSLSISLQLTGCRVLNGKTGELTDKTTAVSNSGKLVLFPSDRSFIIEFALLNYENSKQNSYAYKIEGLDKNWTSIGENSLRINSLPYGNYTLRIKGQSIKGEHSANELTVAILVKKPFYLKNSFILGCILALILLAYGIFRWRLQNLKRAKLRLQETVKRRTQEIQKQKDIIEQDKNIIEQQAEKLKELNATQSRWFTNIAHELRTPLTLILGPIRQFLKKHSGKVKIALDDIRLAEKNSIGLLKLVEEILNVSKLDSNRLKINKTPTDLTQLIREAIAHFDSTADQKGVILATHIPDNITVNIDKEHIRKILINLLSNALKFTHADGRITTSLHHEPHQDVSISITDTGDGIPEQGLPHIFERYFQASDPERVNQGGAGIGLALSLELARLHGGSLSVESQTGKGSVFTLSLPNDLIINSKRSTLPEPMTTYVSPLKITAQPLHKAINAQQDKPVILLVEDNPDMRQYILSFMGKHYKIIEAADGLEALEFLKKTTPDLIVSDIMMPRMDGITLAKVLKSNENFKNIPFITLTAKANEPDKIATLRIGIDDYLTKPFNAEELETRVLNLIHNYRERKAVFEKNTDESIAPTYQDKQLAMMKEFVMDQMQNNAFTINDLAASLNMGPRSLNRFLKKATGLSPGQFIREIRLQQARKLLETKQYPTVLEVVYAIGFENASYFTRLFSERFGKKPSEYL